MSKKVAVGLSGGIDSSFAAYILKKQGYEVSGFTLKFFPQENRCCDLDSLYQAQRLCHHLDIPHYTLDAADFFRREIIQYFIDSYLQGVTPNPCAFCNRLIKFGWFFDKIKSLGMDYLATGHYAKIEQQEGKYFLSRAQDKKKSQEYFLSLVKPQVLSKLIFPLADYQKEEVKAIVKKEKLFFKQRKESQDVCFVTKKPYSDFIERNVDCSGKFSGNIEHVKGKVLGRHKGIYNFTLGQRGGLGIAWTKPLYVIAIDNKTNIVFVGEREYLRKTTFTVGSINWFCLPQSLNNITVKVRYNSPDYECNAVYQEAGLAVTLKKEVEAITPGQIAVFYDGDRVVAGGVIEGERGKL
jgi:tRNA-specific 2-thiouridylase